MQYLVDANVLSEATKPRSDPAAIEWLLANEAEIVVNPIVIGEVRYGILQLPAGKRRARLEQWFVGGLKRLHVLDIDAETAEVWARLLAELKRRGRAMSVKDSLIAATARQHALTVATRNIRDFQHAGVAAINPFEL
jgi:predicted nucleic acid-binding protein